MGDTAGTQLILPLSRQKLAGNRWLELVLDDDHEAELGFMARLLVQATLPHSDPGVVPLWGRQNGALTMHMQPGWEIVDGQPGNIGLPYGSVPRLLLAWVTTEAVRTKERDLILGESLSEFMRKLGLVPTGGRWGSITRLREQMRRLFAATIVVHYARGNAVTDGRFVIADKTVTFWDPKQPDQAALWKSTVTLSERFYSEISQRPVPLDLTVLRALTRSPMAIDIYIWVSYRVSYLRRATTVPWDALELQFGADYERARDFRRKFLAALQKVLLVYPAAVAASPDGLLIAPSSPHIPRRA
jgi:hypothetical protein